MVDELSLFCEVYERRSFTAAARTLRLDPSVVSRRVRRLEARLGVALFRRSTRAVSPTDAAEAFYLRVAPALASIKEAELAASTGGAVLRGSVRLAAPAALGKHRVGPIVHRFSAAHPEVTVTLLLSDRRIDLIQERIDIAIRPGDPGGSSQVVRLLGKSPQWVVASAGYLRRHPMPKEGGLALEGHKVVLWIQGGEVSDFRSALPEPARSTLGVGFLSDDIGAIADAARAGLGIAVLPSWLVSPDVEAGRLVRLPLGPASIEAPIYAVLPLGRQSTGRARALLEALVAGW